MNGSGITYEDVILAQSREEEEKLRKKLEAYENMRKEANEELKNWEKLDLDNLLLAIRKVENILNKVGGSDE